MTGLLRALGAQALGILPALRPAARLRAGAAAIPSDLGQEVESFSTPEPSRAVDASIDRSAEHGATAPPSVPAAIVDSALPDREEAPAIRRADRPIATSAAEEHRSVRELPSIAAHLEQAMRATSAAPARHMTTGIAEHDIQPIKGSDVVARFAQDATPKPARRRNDPARFDVPVRTRELIPREHTTPDVHIHIGRVELTAVTAPAPARRATVPQAKQPMSLDEYLQQRKRKTP
jgi:hypothetical protein